jgi:hypothetical protein
VSDLQSELSDAAAAQGAQLVEHLREKGVIPLIVLGFNFEESELGTRMAILSVWNDRLENGVSDREREYLNRLLERLSGIVAKWMDRDRSRLD